MKYLGKGKIVLDVFRFIYKGTIVEVYEYEDGEERDDGMMGKEEYDGSAEYKIYCSGGGIDARMDEIDLL